MAKARRKKKPTDKRCAILDAALRLFGGRGYDATPVPLVADRAGVATGTIYRYFADKEALVNALYQQWKAAFRDRLAAGYPADAAPRAQFAHLWAAMTRFQREEPEAFAFLENHYHAAYLDKASLALEDEVFALTRLFVDASRAALKPLDADLLSSLVFGAFVQTVKQQAAGRLPEGDAPLAAAEACCWDAIRNHATTSQPESEP